jgi:hypothetical protein
MKGPKKLVSIAVVLLTVASTLGCYPALEKGALRPEEALRQVRLLSPKFRDDMDPNSTTEPTILPASRCARARRPS